MLSHNDARANRIGLLEIYQLAVWFLLDKYHYGNQIKLYRINLGAVRQPCSTKNPQAHALCVYTAQDTTVLI